MKTILCTGGGTLGPVTPLIAAMRVVHALRPDISFAWAGTADGPEKELISREGIPFYVIPTAKLPRYPSMKWLTFPFAYMLAQNEAAHVLDVVQPSLIVGAGGFTQVPIMKQASKKSIPCMIHQLDKLPSLSNRRVSKYCAKVTTTFEYDTSPFSGIKTECISTPCRFAQSKVPTKVEAVEHFGFSKEDRVVLIMGGGTGAQAINRAIDMIREELLEQAYVIHITGSGKLEERHSSSRYIVCEQLDEYEMLLAYAAADIVVSRAGMGSMTELASLAKPSILVPIPQSHQEVNAQAVGDAVIVISQLDLVTALPSTLRHILGDTKRLRSLGTALHSALPTDDGTALATRILSCLT